MHELSFAPYIGSLLTCLHTFNAAIPHNQLSPTFAFDSEKSIWRRQGPAKSEKSENEPEEISVGQGLMFRCSAVKSTDKVIQVCVCVCVCVCVHIIIIYMHACVHTPKGMWAFYLHEYVCTHRGCGI
jgi:hypothetical protein